MVWQASPSSALFFISFVSGSFFALRLRLGKARFPAPDVSAPRVVLQWTRDAYPWSHPISNGSSLLRSIGCAASTVVRQKAKIEQKDRIGTSLPTLTVMGIAMGSCLLPTMVRIHIMPNRGNSLLPSYFTQMTGLWCVAFAKLRVGGLAACRSAGCKQLQQYRRVPI
ncbi:hypothetical protein QBC35DRAFT_178154 [Podospora australis]|uniref:Uncharacterized protein n=1 Tax=Podospora australis TaxID=1536484 RepID=A0AAN6WWL6_9PEZI|nr:hypothetical protein QBC35DRAFT_178154 [Podospora australis]